MTQPEINKLHKSISTDFKIVVRKTELWTLPYCYEILHDVKKLMLFHYVESISLIMNNINNVPIKVKKYHLGSTDRVQDDRPGNIDWEDGEGSALTVLITHTQAHRDLSPDQKVSFQRDNLKIPWTNSNIDGNFPHLSQTRTKSYTHESSGVDRIDFN